MDTTMVTGVLREAVGVVIKLGGPMLVLSMAAGVVEQERELFELMTI